MGNVHDCHTTPYTDVFISPYLFNGDRSRFNMSGIDWTSIPINTGAVLTLDYNVIENVQW